MDKFGVIPDQAKCKYCNGKGCPHCLQAGRTYKCAVCGKYDCEHLKPGKEKPDDSRDRST